MPDTNLADKVAVSSDKEFKALLSEAIATESLGKSDNDEVNFGDLSVTAEAIPVGQEQKPAEPVKTIEPVENKLPENHDPDATLKEETPKSEKTEVKESATVPQYVKDAQNLAKKWDVLDQTEKSAKLQNLAKQRPQTFKALAQELGTSPDLLMAEAEMDPAEFNSDSKPDFDPESIIREAEERAYNRLKAEFGTQTTESEKNRFTSEVQAYAKHNGLSPEITQYLVDDKGELFQKFQSIKYDPSTGQEMTLKGRLRFAIASNEQVQKSLIEAGAIKKAERLIAGINSALPSSGKSPKTIGNLDVNDLANADDAEFAKGMSRFSQKGIVPIKF